MRRLWARWLAWSTRQDDTRPLAMTRILVALCILGDQLRLLQLGLAGHLYRPYAHGGLSGFTGVDYALNALGPDAGLMAWGVLLVCMVLVATGVGTRPAMLVGVLAYTQLGHLYPPGDRAIDRVLRTVLLILIFSQSHRRWSLWSWLRKKAPLIRAPALPADLVRWLMVLIYLAAGFGKLGNGRWIPGDGPPVLYRIMTDPTSADLDHLFWFDLPLPFHIGALATLALELSAPLLLTRFAPYWAIGGIGLHLGIAATMGLGIFPWGMLALYPLVLSPWLARGLDRLGRPRASPGPLERDPGPRGT